MQGDKDLNTFYRWRESDSEPIEARYLREGDELVYGGWNGDAYRYGVLPIEEVQRAYADEPDGIIYARFHLPVGACMQSDKNVEITVSWQGEVPRIAVEVQYKPGYVVHIRRKSAQEVRSCS